jgi:hypothetical protein
MELNRTGMHLGQPLVRSADGIIGATVSLFQRLLRDLTDLEFGHLFFFEQVDGGRAAVVGRLFWDSIRPGACFRTHAAGLTDYLALIQGRQINLAPFAMRTGLKGFWSLVIVALFVLAYPRKYSFTFLYIVDMSVIIFVAICVLCRKHKRYQCLLSDADASVQDDALTRG